MVNCFNLLNLGNCYVILTVWGGGWNDVPEPMMFVDDIRPMCEGKAVDQTKSCSKSMEGLLQQR